MEDSPTPSVVDAGHARPGQAARKLSVSSHQGPPVVLPWRYRELTVDEQLVDAAERLRDTKAPRPIPKWMATPPGSSRSISRVRRQIMQDRRTRAKEVPKVFLPDQDERYREMVAFVHSLQPVVFMGKREEDNVDEVQASTGSDDGESGGQLRVPQVPAPSSSSPEQPPAELGAWTEGFRIQLQKLLTQVGFSLEKELVEPQVQQLYEWYKAHRQPPKDRLQRVPPPPLIGAQPFLQGEAVIHKPIPGSSFYVPERGDAATRTAEQSLQEEGENAADVASRVGDPLRMQAVQLPSARERLRSFETKQIVSREGAMKMKAGLREDAPSPEPPSRPFTPSTATGGAYTARSSTVPSSARSSPTPPFSSRPSSAARPSSAMDYTSRRVTGLDSSRPGTAPRARMRPPTMPLSARPGSAASSSRAPATYSPLTEAAVREAEERQKMAVAEQNMEERWLMRRHRDIANQMIDEERHTAVATWAERRARVEEEIAANAEAMRFQSELWQRGYSVPADAQEDIAVTVAAQQQGRTEQLSTVRSETALSDSAEEEEEENVPLADEAELPHASDELLHGRISRPQSAPRYDVSRVEAPSDGRHAHFRTQSKHAALVQPAGYDRIANLRRMHKHLIRDTEEDEMGNDEYESGSPRCIFDTAAGQNHVSLSKYTQDQTQAQEQPAVARPKDDSDVLAAVCDWWRAKHGTEAPTPADCGITLDEMRFKQQQEAAAVKRRLAHWSSAANRHVNAAVIDAALVMPMHVHKPDGAIFNATPDLGCFDEQFRDLLQHHPWAKEYLAKRACIGTKKKKKKKKGGRAKSRNSRSPKRSVRGGRSSPR
mmetsp:Transcript_94143/g.177015  ORF Transcript_94143/g.177015 Transcript_94143/m.177015 type:complete len:829 (-) Transcript_94143:52-2538(-)